jgi:hypothetical protein
MQGFEMIICPECKRKNLDKARICEQCGAFLKGGARVRRTAPTVSRTVVSAATKSHDAQKIIITDIKVPFWSMVILMVKLVFASIPAIIIIALFVLFLISAASGLGNFAKIFLEKINLL